MAPQDQSPRESSGGRRSRRTVGRSPGGSARNETPPPPRPAGDPHRRIRSHPTTSPRGRRSSGCSKPTPGSIRSPTAWSGRGSTALPTVSSSTSARTASSRITPRRSSRCGPRSATGSRRRCAPAARSMPTTCRRAGSTSRSTDFSFAPTRARVRQARHGRVPVPLVLRAVDARRSTTSHGSASAPATYRSRWSSANREWLDTKHREPTLKFFEEHRLSFVCVDVPPGFPSSLPPLTAATTDLAVVRFHGRNGDAWERGADTGDDRMSYDYRRGDLEPWAAPPGEARRGGASRSMCSSPPGRPSRPRATRGSSCACSPRSRVPNRHLRRRRRQSAAGTEP